MKALFTCVLLLLPLTLAAQIKYTDIQPDTLIADTNDIPGLYMLDLDGDGYTDFFVMHVFYPVPVYVLTVHTEYSTIHELLLDANDRIAALPPGTFIADSSQQWRCTANGGGSAGMFFSRAWFGTGDHYIGLRVRSNGAWHYGWLRAEVASDESSILLKDFAVETNGDTPVAAGATGVESVHRLFRPGDIDIIVEGRYVTVSLPTTASVDIAVYNIIGREQHTQTARSAQLTVNLSDLPRGLYFLRVATSYGTVVQRLALIP